MEPATWAADAVAAVPGWDVLFRGAVGGGKSDGLLVISFGRRCNTRACARILFRRSFPELGLITRSRGFTTVRGGCSKKDRTWYSPEGDTLKMRFIESRTTGRNTGVINTHVAGFDEAGNWPDRRQSTSCGATSFSNGVPCKRRLTANPGGAGQGWIKARYIDPAPPMTPFLAPVGSVLMGRR